MFDQAHRFLIEVKNAEKVAELNKLLDQERDTVRGLAKDLHAGTINLQQYTAQAKPSAAAAVALTNDINKLKASTRDMNRFALEGAHAFQDWAQGGVGGLLNNVPRLTEFIGGPMGLGAAISGLLVTAYLAAPAVKALYKELTDGGHAVPEGADALERLNEALKDGKKRLDEMRESWGGTAGEVRAYNDLMATTTRLEKEANDERERRAKLDAMRKAEKEGDAEAGGIAAAAIEEAGGTDKVIADLAAQKFAESAVAKAALDQLRKTQETLERRLAEETDPINRMAVQEFYNDQLAKDRAAVAAAQRAAGKRAGGVVAAAGDGDQAAIAELARRFPNRSFAQATTAGQKAARKEEDAFIASTERTPEEKAARREAQLEKKADAHFVKQQREQDSRLAQYQGEAAKKNAARDQARASRRAGYAAEMKEAETSTPEELRQSEALEYLEGYVKRNDPGAKLSNKDQVEISERMLENRDAGMSAREATEAALRDRRNGVRLNRDVREGAQIAGIASREFGVDLSPEQAATALKEARDLVQQGMAPNVAGRQAIMGVVQDIVGMVRQNIDASNFQAAEIAQMRMFLGQLRQAQQVAPTLLGHGR